MATDALEVIRTKRDGRRLSAEQIDWFIEGYTTGRVADEQAAALLMAIVFQGLDADELATWTAAMIASGERLDLSEVAAPTVDKHSTGGVGDKVSLVLCPLVAACGAAVPQLSGRGLGHTGGTLDKLEAIEGWRSALSVDQIVHQLGTVGAVICAAGDRLAPADRRLYALRDVTGTVESIPLIASSIMSKKIAEGTASLVLDVKVGSGAFLPDLDAARRLARTMVGLGRRHGVATVAVVTDMDAPLGRACGNGLELDEAIEVLSGAGPPDVVALTLALAREMLGLAGLVVDPAPVLAGGQALQRFRSLVAAQGGDLDAPRPGARIRHLVPAASDGYLRRLDARAVGIAAWRLGAGRARKEDPVSASAGIVCLAKPGDRLNAGQPVLELHADTDGPIAAALAALDRAIDIGHEAPAMRPLVMERIAEEAG